MLQAKKKFAVKDDGDRVASLCRMLRRRTKHNMTPNKIISIRNATGSQLAARELASSNKQNQQGSNNQRRQSTNNLKTEQRPNESSKSHLQTVQMNNCKVHKDKEGVYELDGAAEFFCEKCAIQLTNQGHRLMRSNSNSKFRRCLEQCMNAQLCSVQRAYRELMARLEGELLQLETRIRQAYEAELSKQQLSAKVQIPLFKPQNLSNDILGRIKSYVGRMEMKTVSAKQLTAKNDEQSRDTESVLSSSDGVRPFSQRSKILPTQILIELGNQQFLGQPIAKGQHTRKDSTLRHEIQNFLRH